MTSAWVHIAENAWYQRYEPWDVNVGVVRGQDGLCVVDARGSLRQAYALIDDLAALGGPVRAVVNTHCHFDHTWGNGAFAVLGAEVWGHVSLPETMERWFADVRDSLIFGDPSLEAELAEVECVPPDHLVDPAGVVDLGDCEVEVRFLGPGHTDGDVIVVPSSGDVVFAGDLVEQSGPPAYGDDSDPLAWPSTAALLLDRLGPGTAVVPGHGRHVDARFCHDQHERLLTVADLFGELHAAGVPAREALSAGGDRWPIPVERLGEAVLRAYELLGGR